MARGESDPAGTRIALLDPTKFLGNLLIAGGLIQAFARECRRRRVSLLLVLDRRYRSLVESALPDVQVVWYPRDELKSPWKPAAWVDWWQCVRAIRAFGADLAFPVEDDSVAHQLTRLSGARCRVSSSTARNPFGFHQVLPVQRSGRAPPASHIWYSYLEVFQRLGYAESLPGAPAYMTLPRLPDAESLALEQWLQSIGVVRPSSRVVLHAGGTKHYKMWPVRHFTALARTLVERGFQVLLIGAGDRDAATNRMIRDRLHCRKGQVVDLCDRLSLPALAGLFRNVRAVVGNDSGPMHLAGAVGAHGVVIFGPTDTLVWHPLTESVQMVENRSACDPRCRRRICYRDYVCLRGITPDAVLDRLTAGPIQSAVPQVVNGMSARNRGA